MRKAINRIFLIILIFAIGMMSVIINQVQASIASVNCTNATVGEGFTVSFGLPSGARGIQGNITVTFSDGSKQNGKIVYVSGLDQDSPNAANFTASSEGTATIQVTNIEITANDGSVMEQGGSTQKQINIAGKTQPTTPTTPSTPNTPDTSTQNPPTTNVPEPTFTNVNEKVYAKENCNVRSSYSSSSNRVGGLKKGDELTRTGIGSNGWSKVLYNGKLAYVSSSLLTKDAPVEIENTNTTVNNTNTVDQNTNTLEENTNVVDNQNETLLELQEQIGVLPEVGNNISVLLYITTSIFAGSIVMYIIFEQKKYNKKM